MGADAVGSGPRRAELIAELDSDVAQAQSQALHTLSKIGDRRGWEAIDRMSSDCGSSPIPTPRWPAVRGDPRCPWCRVRIERILHQLVTQLGRGDLETQKSLSRALVALGDDLVSVVDGSVGAEEETVRAHALATVEMFHDPDAGFAHAMGEAKRVVALGSEATA